MNYCDRHMQNYLAICQSPSYSPVFKLSFPDYVNEREQRSLLIPMITDNLSLEMQLQNMEEILRKEGTSFKSYPLYTEDFVQIQKLLTEQVGLLQENNQHAYQELQTNKEQYIGNILERMWRNRLI
jgi:hypothetical protein